ncbi:unnamed protein product [Amoebophrya sp. A25]|nr:unnamed protein product [Amoebophrya sp. A25]|eukprot:GSA25T00012701001.1
MPSSRSPVRAMPVPLGRAGLTCRSKSSRGQPVFRKSGLRATSELTSPLRIRFLGLLVCAAAQESPLMIHFEGAPVLGDLSFEDFVEGGNVMGAAPMMDDTIGSPLVFETDDPVSDGPFSDGPGPGIFGVLPMLSAMQSAAREQESGVAPKVLTTEKSGNRKAAPATKENNAKSPNQAGSKSLAKFGLGDNALIRRGTPGPIPAPIRAILSNLFGEPSSKSSPIAHSERVTQQVMRTPAGVRHREIRVSDDGTRTVTITEPDGSKSVSVERPVRGVKPLEKGGHAVGVDEFVRHFPVQPSFFRSPESDPFQDDDIGLHLMSAPMGDMMLLNMLRALDHPPQLIHKIAKDQSTKPPASSGSSGSSTSSDTKASTTASSSTGTGGSAKFGTTSSSKSEQEKSAEKQESDPCAEDLVKFQCQDVEHRLHCLGKHEEQLQSSCRDSISSAVPFVCHQPINDFQCATISTGGSVLDCLEPHKASLDEKCRNSVEMTSAFVKAFKSSKNVALLDPTEVSSKPSLDVKTVLQWCADVIAGLVVLAFLAGLLISSVQRAILYTKVKKLKRRERSELGAELTQATDYSGGQDKDLDTSPTFLAEDAMDLLRSTTASPINSPCRSSLPQNSTTSRGVRRIEAHEEATSSTPLFSVPTGEGTTTSTTSSSPTSPNNDSAWKDDTCSVISTCAETDDCQSVRSLIV